MQALFRAEEPNHSRRIIRVFEWKIIRCPETGPSKQASLRNSARSLIERRAEPLGNLNKGLPSAPRVAYPFLASCACITSHHITSHHITSQPLGGLAPPLVKKLGGLPLFHPISSTQWGHRQWRPPRTKNQGPGGLPFFQGARLPKLQVGAITPAQ